MPQLEHMCEITWLHYVDLPGQEPRPCAVLLLDQEDDSLRVRFTQDWSAFNACDLDILGALAEDLHAKAEELGARALLSYLKATLSHTLRISDSQPLLTANPDAELDHLERELSWGRAYEVVADHALHARRQQLTVVSQRLVESTITHLFTAARYIMHSFRPVRACDVLYAAVSALCVLGIVSTSAYVLHRTSHTKGAQVSFVQMAPGSSKEQPANLVMPRGLPIKEVYVSTLVTTPKRRTRRARQSEQHRANVVLARMYVPPETRTDLPEVAMLLPSDVVVAPESERAVAVPPMEVATLPPAPEQVRGVRRVLLALISPLRKLGRSLTD